MHMALSDITSRALPPKPWAEAENIPWHDLAFSTRMLREHLSQAHDAASRRHAIIDRHVAWIHEVLLAGQTTRILDLGCGPGLYTSRLARLGHACIGIDYSPASIHYAQEQAEQEKLTCQYELRDIRLGNYGQGYGLAMLIFGELNVFPREIAMSILRKMYEALGADGVLLLEPHTYEAVWKMGKRGQSWYTARKGVFGDAPYLCLTEHFWHESVCATTTRHYVIDAAGELTRYAQTMQAYTDDGYRELLAACGFKRIDSYPSLAGEDGPAQEGLHAIVARKS